MPTEDVIKTIVLTKADIALDGQRTKTLIQILRVRPALPLTITGPGPYLILVSAVS